MTTNQLKAYLDAHGVPGSTPPDGRWYAIDLGGRYVGIAFAAADGCRPMGSFIDPAGYRYWDSGADSHDILRHAPLPDVAALLAAVEALRGKPVAGDCSGAVLR